jgi:hypothetical protein
VINIFSYGNIIDITNGAGSGGHSGLSPHGSEAVIIISAGPVYAQRRFWIVVCAVTG